jgi:chromosomal replication initiator protein
MCPSLEPTVISISATKHRFFVFLDFLRTQGLNVRENNSDHLLATELWTCVCAELQEILHVDVYSRWISVISPCALTDGVLVLEVENDFYQTWLEDNYLPLIHQAIKSIRTDEVKTRFQVADVANKPAPAALAPAAEQDSPQQTLDLSVDSAPPSAPPPADKTPTAAAPRSPRQADSGGARLNPRFTFENFIIGPSNNFAHAASLAVSQAPARAYNPLFVYGGTGLGKTHLMASIGHHVLQNSRAKICYVSSEAFLNEYINALTTRSLVQFRRKYRNTDLLLIDDIHFLASKEQLQEEFFHTFNTLFDARKQIVMTSDRPASEISGLEQRLVSRFEWGLVTELEPPDLETRIAILRYRQEKAEYKLSDDLLLFIAEHIRSNIRRLEGALIRAISYASLTNRDLTLDSLKYLLRDTLEQEMEAALSFADIQRAVADHFDIRLSDMTSKNRQRSVAAPRQLAMYLCRRMTDSSFPNIAEAFGKTHATILHAYRQVDSRLDVDPELKRSMSAICGKLGRSVTV